MTTPRTRADWQAMADGLVLRTQAFIDGEYVDAADGATFDCISPIDGRVLGKVAAGGQADIDRAVRAARRSFEAGGWSRARPVKRKKILQKLVALIEKHADELALLETLDMGKPIDDARNVDIAATIRCLGSPGSRRSASIRRRITGSCRPKSARRPNFVSACRAVQSS